MRRAAKRDSSEPGIVSALEAAGFQVWRYLPCDLLTYREDKGFHTLECKPLTASGKVRKRTDQPEQAAFIALTKTPVVGTPEAALKALGAI